MMVNGFFFMLFNVKMFKLLNIDMTFFFVCAIAQLRTGVSIFDVLHSVWWLFRTLIPIFYIIQLHAFSKKNVKAKNCSYRVAEVHSLDCAWRKTKSLKNGEVLKLYFHIVRLGFKHNEKICGTTIRFSCVFFGLRKKESHKF